MKNNNKKLKFTILMTCLFSFAISTCFFFVSSSISEFIIRNNVNKNELRQSEQNKKILEFQSYVRENNIKITDTKKISDWSKRNPYLYLKILKDDELIYDSINEKDFRYSLSQDPDVYTPYGLSSVHLLAWDDSTVKVIIYCFTEFRIMNFTRSIILLISFGIFFIIVLLVIKQKVKIISSLTQEVKGLIQHDLNRPITTSSNDEIGDIASCVEVLRATVLEKMENERIATEKNYELISSLSHDLRTPLTSIIGYLEIMNNPNVSYLNQKKYIDITLKQAYRLKDLSDSLFDYSLSSITTSPIVMEIVNGNELIMQMVEESVFELEAIGFIFKKNISDLSCMVNVNISIIHRMFENIFSNIKKYADINTPVNIGYGISNNYLFVYFKNKKNNYTVHDKNNIGLSNIKRFIELHSGKLIINNNKEFFDLTVLLPIIK